MHGDVTVAGLPGPPSGEWDADQQAPKRHQPSRRAPPQQGQQQGQQEGQDGPGFGSQYNRGKVVSSTTKAALDGMQFSELGLSANTMRCGAKQLTNMYVKPTSTQTGWYITLV